jgi:lipopolysaccharide transport system ATP-binding protein
VTYRVITVENLSKKYFIDHQQEQRYRALRDVLTEKARGFSSRLTRPFKTAASLNRNSRREECWALKDVSFDVRHGEIVGIIGRNGAGKSTLLKVLSRITEPTAGRVGVKGRVASLLEVGTGFHPELTGRENIFLNGAILGMGREEIRRKFDEIVAFAEVEKFLDTPVKRYSSGMYVRLAFAVAAHLEPEILVVDEVLAVGDSKFQKKCLGKMQDVSRGGRTVLFVSHNFAALQHLCTRAVLLRSGQLALDGEINKVLESYASESAPEMYAQADLRHHKNRLPTAIPFFTAIEITVNGYPSTTPRMGEGLELKLSYKSPRPLKGLGIGITINNRYNQRLVVFSVGQQAPELLSSAPISGTICCRIPSLNLLPGLYHITVISADGKGELDRIEESATIEILPEDVFGTGKTPGPEHGLIFQAASWSVSWQPSPE